MSLATISENASRFGMRLTETISEHTRDLNIGRTSSALYLDTPDEKLKNVAKQLDSNSDREKLDALRRLIAMISKGRNVSEYFAQVVKNVASQNLEVRKLVYIYLLRYAEHEPDLALLSINTFQKDLTDSNPLIRAMALRILSGIKVPMLGSIVILAIRKCAADISPYVRKAAALAIPKCNDLSSTHLPILTEIITSLLRDRSPLSIGCVAVAFEAVCPTRLDLLHQQYRRLCKVLVDVDEWGQVVILDLLLRYARTMLPKPSTSSVGEGETQRPEDVDRDLQLLLTSAEPLLQSMNPAVVLTVVRLFYYAGPPSLLPKTLNPLLRLLHTSPAVERVVLAYLLVLSCPLSVPLAPLYSRFFIRSDDPQQVKLDKIKLLLRIISAENHQAILREFIDCADDVDDQLVSSAIKAIGQYARLVPDGTSQCMSALMDMIKSQHDVVVSNAILVLKSLVQSRLHSPTEPTGTSTHSHLSIISHLGQRIEEFRHPQARACALWLVGQYCTDLAAGGTTERERILPWVPDVLRKTARTFPSEATLVRLQIVTLSAKLLSRQPSDHTLGLLSRYVFSLARYDLDYDVRDRARMLSALLRGFAPCLSDEGTSIEQGGVVLRKEQVQRLLFHGKGDIVETKQMDYNDLPLGLGAVVSDKGLRGDSLPDWLEQGTESSLRDSEDDKPAAPTQPVFVKTSSWLSTPVASTPIEGLSPKTTAARNGGSIGPYTDLDRFYAESDDAEEDVDSEEDGSEAASDKQHGRHSNDESEGDDDGDESEESEGA